MIYYSFSNFSELFIVLNKYIAKVSDQLLTLFPAITALIGQLGPALSGGHSSVFTPAVNKNTLI